MQIRVRGLFLLSATWALCGCRHAPPPGAGDSPAMKEAKAKLCTDMTEQEVAAALGPPSEFHPAKRDSDDVAIYKVGDSTLTIYFYQNRLKRFRAFKGDSG